MTRVMRRAALARTWGDCFGYFALATGGADVMLDPQLSYWDIAAVVPVVEGAGGRVSGWRGGNPFEERSLVATGGDLHAEVLRLIANPGARARVRARSPASLRTSSRAISSAPASARRAGTGSP